MALNNPETNDLPALRNPATIESPTIQDLTELSNLKYVLVNGDACNNA